MIYNAATVRARRFAGDRCEEIACVGVSDASEMPGTNNEKMWCINGGTVSGFAGFVFAQAVIMVSLGSTVSRNLGHVTT